MANLEGYPFWIDLFILAENMAEMLGLGLTGWGPYSIKSLISLNIRINTHIHTYIMAGHSYPRISVH